LSENHLLGEAEAEKNFFLLAFPFSGLVDHHSGKPGPGLRLLRTSSHSQKRCGRGFSENQSERRKKNKERRNEPFQNGIGCNPSHIRNFSMFDLRHRIKHITL
jgi:hypothetical protein